MDYARKQYSTKKSSFSSSSSCSGWSRAECAITAGSTDLWRGHARTAAGYPKRLSARDWVRELRSQVSGVPVWDEVKIQISIRNDVLKSALEQNKLSDDKYL